MKTCKECIHNEMCCGTHTDDSPICCDFIDLTAVVVLPCKVGDTVYIFNETFKHSNKIVLKCQVNEFVIDSGGPAAVLDCVEQFYTKRRYTARPISDFGSVIFLDRAAAEQAALNIVKNAHREQQKICPVSKPCPDCWHWGDCCRSNNELCDKAKKEEKKKNA